MRRSGVAWLALGALLTAASGCGTQRENRGLEAPVNAASAPADRAGPPEVGDAPPMPEQRTVSEVPGVRVEEVAQGLEIPWDLEFAPDGRLFFTERPGRVQVLAPGGEPQVLLRLESVVHQGEGGLMGLALHPRFAKEPFLYLMYTAERDGGSVNRISRFRVRNGAATDEQVLLDNIPAAQYHDGGALDFGPDGLLYAGTGDARKPPLAQDLGSLAGKILRLNPDGSIPADNPIADSPVYAYGFRNVTGLAWHPETRALWAANHGPSGEWGLQARDAVYVVQKGANHGWPVVVGTTDRAGIISPILYYPNEAVPPGGALFYTGDKFPQFRGDFFLTSLGATHLQHVIVEGGREIAAIERWWPGRYGRLRAIEQGPDGAIYFSTSNEDGRARRNHPGSDFIYRVLPERAGN